MILSCFKAPIEQNILQEHLRHLKEARHSIDNEPQEETPSKRVLGSGYFELCFSSVRYRQYPFKLVDLLQSGAEQSAAAAAFLSAPACTLDNFSLEFRKRFPTLSEITSSLALKQLRLVLSSISGTTFETERAHSKNLRQKRSRVMTHSMDFADLGVSHFARSSPHVAAALLGESPQIDSAPAKQHSDSDLQDTVVSKDKPRGQHDNKKAGGGGAWRAFLHQEAMTRSAEAVDSDSCRPGRSYFSSQSSQAYHALGDDQKKRLEVLGRSAAWLHRTALIEEQVCRWAPMKETNMHEN